MEITKIYDKIEHSNHSLSPKYSILIPLVEVEDETHVLFEVRSMNLRRNPGQICFPGGKIEKEDLDPQDSAVRETMEELGIHEHNIENVIPLETIVSSQNHVIYLFIGKITDITRMQPNEEEVGEVFTVPLQYLLKNKPITSRIHYKVVPEEGFPYDLIGGKEYKWSERYSEHYFYPYDGKVIWGLTARVLTYFLSILEDKSN